MNSASSTATVLRPALEAIVGALTWKRAAVAATLALVIAALLNPVFTVPFWVLLGRMVFIAALLLVVFAAAGTWHPRQIPRWLAQVLAVVIAAPIATVLAYLPSIDGNLANLLQHEGRVMGFIFITASVLFIAPLLALGALYRERDAQARAAQLGFALERSTLEKEALDTRLKLLQAQIEPHFLFNTLANVQALVESGSSQAAPVLKSLIAYLRAAMPRLHAGAPTLGNEIALVRSYLELMQMRMPDRLAFSIDVAEDIAAREFLPMSVLTLVENAVRHGIDPGENGGRIDVSARREVDGSIRLVVADTGVGMSESAVPGTGLANLESRLRGFFGAAGRLELHEARPHGLSAEIVFPPHRPEGAGDRAAGARA
ncbi:MAG: histidine kinase [Burkholderiales bacterium]|nr:histidine kinase [Burkholderiales bacterium]